MPASSFWPLLKETGAQWLASKAPRLGAALAYYAIFSLAPLLILAIGIAGMIFGQDAVQSEVVGQLQSLVGEEGGQAIRTMLDSASRPGSGIIGTVLGVAMLLIGASGLFGQLQDALNTIWQVQPKPGRGVRGFIHDRLLSFSMVLVVAFLLLVSLVVTAALAAVGNFLGDWKATLIGFLLQTLLDLVVLTVLFAMIYRYLPDAEIAWRDVWLGAAITTVLFIVGKFLIGFYLGQVGVASAYGASGSLAVLLVWLYYASQIFLFGAEFTKTYATRRGLEIVPMKHAERLTAECLVQQGIRPTQSQGHAVAR